MKSQLIPWGKDGAFGLGNPCFGLENPYFEEIHDFRGILEFLGHFPTLFQLTPEHNNPEPSQHICFSQAAVHDALGAKGKKTVKSSYFLKSH